jgi:hypothetical protein
MDFLTWQTFWGVMLGTALGVLLSWLTETTREPPAPRELPPCPHGCGFPRVHFHYGHDGKRYYYRGARFR